MDERRRAFLKWRVDVPELERSRCSKGHNGEIVDPHLDDDVIFREILSYHMHSVCHAPT